MQMTEKERIAWQRAYEREQERRRKALTQPVTPDNPIQPRQRGHGGRGLPRR